MSVNAVGFVSEKPLPKGPVLYATRSAKNEPETTVNFEGRKEYDSFEKKESHTGRNIAIGTTVGVLALATTAAILGKYGIKIPNAKNFFTKGINTIIDKCHIGAAFLKKWCYTKPLNAIKGCFNKGGNPPATP